MRHKLCQRFGPLELHRVCSAYLLGRGEGDEAEATRLLGHRVAHHDAVHHLAELRVVGAKTLVRGGDVEAADEELPVLLRVEGAVAGVALLRRCILLLRVVAVLFLGLKPTLRQFYGHFESYQRFFSLKVSAFYVLKQSTLVFTSAARPQRSS